MVRVLIIGATGYMGSALASSLLRSGHYTVYGLARTEKKARQLAADEVIPVVAEDPAKTPQPVLDAIQAAHIDVVVLCGADDGAHEVLKAVIEAGKQRLRENAAGGAGNLRLGFVYTSGSWVHGSSRVAVTDLELAGQKTSRNPPARLVAWRTGMEQAVLAAHDVLDVLVVRPGLVYGRSHAIWTSFFNPVLAAAATSTPETAVQIPLDERARPGLIHVDDCASGMHAAIDKLPLLKGTGVYPVFDLISQSESMRDIFDAFAASIGFKGSVQLVGHGDDAFAEAMSVTTNNASARARMLLGWEPKRRPFVDGMDAYGPAFAAAQ